MYGNSALTNQSNASVTSGGAGTFVVSQGVSEPRAPIDCGMGVLGDRIENLFRLVGFLDSRFSAVLRSVPPSTGSAPRPTEIVAGSPIGGLLNDRVSQLRDLEARIEDILSRCEL